MSVQFGVKFPSLSLSKVAEQADLTKLGANVVDLAIKAGVKDPQDVVQIAGQINEVDAQQAVAIAGAVIEQQLGNNAELVKTIALGSEDAAMQAFGETIGDASQRFENVATAVNENLGQRAGLFTALAAQQVLGLGAAALQLLRVGAQAAPGALAQIKDKVGNEVAPKLVEGIANQVAVAEAIKSAAPGIATKVGEVCDAAAEALQPQG